MAHASSRIEIDCVSTAFSARRKGVYPVSNESRPCGMIVNIVV
ncbi:MAG: hypothetical protein AAGD92_10215 [Pseudomonadota bacterium]